MPFDNELMLRDDATDLTADLDGTYVAIPQIISSAPLVLRLKIPEMSTSGTIVPTLQLSNDGTVNEVSLTLPTIDAAGDYYWPLIVPRDFTYVAIDLDVTGASFNAGKVAVGLVPASRYAGWWKGPALSI